jgi:uncharacterized damage-inducible protein DinB
VKKVEILTLLDYSSWATGRVLDVAATISAEQFAANPNRHLSSLREMLVHMLSAEQLWRTRMETGVSSATLAATDFPDVDTLRQQWQREDRAMRAYLSTLEDDALGGSFRYRRSTGELSDPLTRWHTLLHLVNHSTQHRSEAAMLLTAFGRSPGDLDFGWFLHGGR